MRNARKSKKNCFLLAFPWCSTFDRQVKGSTFFDILQKKMQKNLRNREKYITFAPAKPQKVCPLLVFGALDERFSLRSAKPARAVRLRHAPLKRLTFVGLFYFSSRLSIILRNFAKNTETLTIITLSKRCLQRNY